MSPDDLAVEDKWILSRLSACIEECDRRLGRYQYNEYINAVYAFFWSEYCDWYIELVKPRLFGRNDAGEMVTRGDESAHVARRVLAWVLDQTLRLLHPVTPFITEALWKQLNEIAPVRGVDRLYEVRSQGAEGPRVEAKTTNADISSALILASWPDASAWKREADVEGEMQALQDVIRTLREIRNHVNGIRSAARESAIRTLPRAVVRAEARLARPLQEREAMILRLGQCDAVEIGPDAAKPAESASKVLSGVEVFVPLTGLADLEIERKRLSKERDELSGHIARLEKKLGNAGFVAKAPAAVVEKERARLGDLQGKLAAVQRNLAEVGG